MAKREWGWEFLRFGVAIALIGGCGWAIWNRTARPLIEKGIGPSEALREVKLGVHRWSFERRKEQIKREIEAAKAVSQGGTPVQAGSQGTVLPTGVDAPSK